eukprot:8216714-Karenia_brevis.AAC.1
MSWEVPDNHKVSHSRLLAKPFVEYGFVSGRSTWAHATQEEQKRMDETLWLPEAIPMPIVEAMPALNASRRQPWPPQFLRVHFVDGRELNQSRGCYVGLECNGKDVSGTR